MKHLRTIRPILETLEDRLVPTLNITQDTLGNMTISGIPNGPVVLQFTANNTFALTDNGVPVGTFTAPANLAIVVPDPGNDTVTVNLDNGVTAFNLNGSLSIQTGAGVDSVTISSAGVPGGTVGGNVLLNGVNSLRTDSVNIGGNLSFNSFQENVGNNLDFITTQIGGSLTALTGNGLDNVTLIGGTTVGRSISLNLGNGDSVFNQSSNSVVGGSFSYQGGSGNDDVTIDGVVGGSVYLNLGVSVTANSFTFGQGAVVGGSLTVLGGPFSDNIVDFSGTLAGSAYFNLGNIGSVGNSLTINPTGSIFGASFTYLGGAGVDSVSLNGTFYRTRVYLNLGAGNDTLVLGGNANLSSLYVDFGPGMDTFTNNLTGPFTYPVVLLNLP